MVIFLSSLFYIFLLFLFTLKQQRSTNISLLFFSSGLLTLALVYLGMFVLLPFAGADSVRFERVAWYWSQGSLSEIAKTINLSASYLISSITAYIYYFIGREPFVAVLVNAVLGLFVMLYSLKLYQAVWPKDESKKLVFFFFIVAFWPMLKINSAVLLRENYIILFLLIGSVYLARFASKSNLYHLLLASVWIVFASFFHGGSIIYLFGVPVFLLLYSKISLSKKVVILLLSVAILAVIMQALQFGKLSAIQDSDSALDALVDMRQSMQEANSAYLQWLVPTNPIDIIWQAPIRILFFLTKPFLWDIRSAGIAIVAFDALIWTAILYLIYKNWAEIKENRAAVMLLVCCFVAFFAFSYGTSNYGTAVRHRTKFFIEMFVIAAPFFKTVRFTRRY